MKTRLFFIFVLVAFGSLCLMAGCADMPKKPNYSVNIPQEWRKVQMRRARVEMPGMYSGDDQSEYAEVVDRQLERALDMLEAVRIFNR